MASRCWLSQDARLAGDTGSGRRATGGSTRRAEQALDERDAALIRRLFESYLYISDLVEDKTTTIRRLRELFFGKRTEKTKAVMGRNEKTAAGDPAAPAAGVAADTVASPGDDQEADGADKPCPGHGRNGADAYRGAERVEIPHPSLTAGDACPACGQGTIYAKAPGVLVRITGQPPLTARIYELQKLRCHLCGEVFTAPAPAEAGERKYAATAGSMIGLLKYGSGLPFNRLEGLQRYLEIPLPASTQWDIVQAVATTLTPAFEELIRQAAQGEVLHNDDTTVKILELMGAAGRQEALASAATDKDNAEQRTGLFTSGVVALRDGQRPGVVLQRPAARRRELGRGAQASRRGVAAADPDVRCSVAQPPGELQTIVGNCLAHARRQFVDVYDRFPEECGRLLEALAVVYRNDAVARERQLSPQARLEFHQQESRPTMQRLHDWLRRQLEEKLTEPNSALGGAIKYVLRHWEKLTLFLRQAGAPLDNNICERP